MDALNQNYMEKSKAKKKSDYIDELVAIARTRAEKLTVKQLREIIARHA